MRASRHGQAASSSQADLIPSERKLIELILRIPSLKGKRHKEGELLLVKVLAIELDRELANDRCEELRAALQSLRRIREREQLEADLEKSEKLEKQCDRRLRNVGVALQSLFERPLFPKGEAIKFTKARRKTMSNDRGKKLRARN